MSIPSLNQNGELPEGDHVATLIDVEIAFGLSTDRRKHLTDGFKRAVDMFKAAGVEFVLVDGSYTTDKADPEDIDGCWSASGDIDIAKIDPVFWKFSNSIEFQAQRVKAKAQYVLDFFIAENIEAGSGKPFSDFFKTNREGDPKRIIKIVLNERCL